ncbi:MAG: serine/threonine protein kinase [bacterium]|nr:serine/threonine protein kinase [bacterium]
MAESSPEAAAGGGSRAGDADGPDHEGPAASVDEADARLAEVLSGETTTESLRHSLTGERSDESEDLLARLDALDFVHNVVGQATDVPDRIAEYEIKGLLGRGGMGTVYLGYQQELEREVAVKVLSPSYSADPTMRKRFRAEARATAALHHRHIVPIYDYGEAQSMLFFTMERVDGMSLDKHISAARHLRRPHMDPIEAAHRFAGVADALGLAHRRRLLHRDVKPGNILVAADGTLALTDFGLAKALDNVSAQLTSKGGGFLGTLHYSSPEQALGDDLTPASDLYSLGVTIFESVAGRLPFAAKTTEALLAAILHGTPQRLREVDPKVPRDLDAVVEKLLSREPADRYQDGEALARDLLRIRDGEPVHIRRLPLVTRLARRARKNPGLASAIAAAVILLLVTLVLLGVWRSEKDRGLVSRHQNRLVQIATDIGNEVGAPTGPVPLLEALTGVPCEAPPNNTILLQALADAHAELPDDGQVRAMEVAYREDPLQSASGHLRDGRGYQALQLFNDAIQEAEAIRGRAGGKLDLAVELRLYRLYLGRGIANLTASVARVNDALVNLALARYLRPGAAFPRTLLTVIDLVQSPNVGAAVAALRRDLVNAAPERRQVFGRLLWAVAGLRPCGQCNVMTFELDYPERRAIHELGQELLGEPLAGAKPRGRPTGLGSQLEARVRELLGLSGEPTALRNAARQVREEIRLCVHPDSPLQGWSGVLQMLEEPQARGPLVDEDGQPLPPQLQLAAWRVLLRLRAPEEAMVLVAPRFEEFYRLHPDLPGIVPVAARIHVRAGTSAARGFVDDWVAEAQGDPQALLLRMQLRMPITEEWLDAGDDAMVAVQRSVDQRAAIQEILRLCQLEGQRSEREDGFLAFSARTIQITTLQKTYELLLEELDSEAR